MLLRVRKTRHTGRIQSFILSIEVPAAISPLAVALSLNGLRSVAKSLANAYSIIFNHLGEVDRPLTLRYVIDVVAVQSGLTIRIHLVAIHLIAGAGV